MSDYYTFEESELSLERFRESSNKNCVTLQELRRAQNQDGVNVETRTSSTSQSRKPFPSSRTKKQLLDKVDLVKICQGCPLLFDESYLPLTWETFAQKLTAHCANDLERVMAIINWITNFDFNSFKNKNNIHFKKNSFMDFVSRARADQLYTDIFKNLCTSCKVPLNRIEGYIKSSKYRIGHKIQEEHKSHWFAVFVEGEWRFIDVRGCCVKVIRAGTGEWKKVAENLDIITTEKAEGKNVFVKDDFYFLTDPENFIFTHFPHDPDWQLLVKPITLKEFEELAAIRVEQFLKMNLTTVSHPKCVMKVPDNGVVRIIFKENGAMRRYSPSLSIHKDSVLDGENKIIFRGKQNLLKQSLMLERIWPSGIALEFQPPKPGKYLLQLLGSSSESDTQKQFIKYVIHCPKTKEEKKILVLPDTIGDAPFGMDRVAASFNIKPSDLKDGHLELENGQKELSYTTANQDLEYEYELCGVDDSQDNEGYLFDWPEDNGKHVVLVIGSDKGHLILLKRCRKKNSTDEFHQFGKYLVIADIGAEDVEEYPFNKRQQIGWKQTTSRTKPLSAHEKPFITCHQSGLNISWTTSEDWYITAELLFIESTTTKSEFKEYLFVDHSSQNKCTFQILFPQMGHYELNIKKNTGGRTNPQIIFTYFIRALGEPFNDPHPFPITNQHFWCQGFKLVYSILLPLCHYKIIIKLRVNIPDNALALNDETAHLQPQTEPVIIIEAPVYFPVNTLVLRDEKERIQMFHKKDNNIWEINFTSGSVGFVSVLIGLSSADKKNNPSYNDLVQFDIQSQNKQNALEQKNAENKVASDDKRRRDELRKNEKEFYAIEDTEEMKSLNEQQKTEKEKLAKEMLQQALVLTSSKKIKKIKSRLNDYRFLIKKDDYLVKKAEECLQELSLKEDLEKALETAYSQNETEPLITFIDKLERSESPWKLVPFPQNVIDNGKSFLKKLDLYKKMTSDVLKLDNETILELLNYTPEGVISIVKGTLLILGHYEKKTEKWILCQSLLNGIQDDIKQFDEKGKRCDPRLAARAEQLMKLGCLEEASTQNSAVALMYGWSNSAIDLIRVSAKSKDFYPASIEEQRNILRITDMEERDYYWENNGM